MIKCLVCGYIIREEIADKNKEAIPFVNSKQNIKYCPFCGVDDKWLVESDDRLLGDKLELDDETLKIINHAMKLEVFNGDFYKEASDLCVNKENKSFFKSLSNIEYTHAQVHRRLCKEKRIPSLTSLNYEKFRGKDDLLLDEALKREEHAINYYKRYYDKVCSDEVRTIFQILSKVEQDHIHLASSKQLSDS